MTLEDIFKTNPSLLETPEVKQLIEYVSNEQSRMYLICENYKNFHDTILDIAMNSALVLKSGNSAEHTLGLIFKELEEC
jgi:hypothetical protein